MKSLTYKVTLILIALSGYIGVNLITPVLADMSASFPSTSPTSMALIVTLPTITMLVGLAVSAFLSTRIRRKTIILTGLVIIISTGLSPYFLNTVELILLSRGALGIGMGLLTPLQASYFAEFDSVIRSKLFGFNNLVNGLLGALLFMSISAFRLSWRQVFLLYSIFILILILVILFLPKGSVLKTEPAAKEANTGRKGSLLQKTFVFSCITIILVMAVYLTAPTTLSFYMSQHQLGGAQEAGTLSAAATICIALSGLAYPLLRQRFKQQTATVSFGLLIVGLIVYAFPLNTAMLWIGFICVSVGPSLISTDFCLQLTEILPTAKVPTANAIFTCCLFAGQFMATYLQTIIMNLFHLASADVTFLVFAALMAVFMILSLFIQKQKPGAIY